MATRFGIAIACIISLPIMLSLQGCSNCGFECERSTGSNGDGTDGNNDDNDKGVSLGFSASASNDIKNVTLTVDKITFRGNNKDDVVIDTFTISDLNVNQQDSFQINLMNYQYIKQVFVIKELKDLKTGRYTNIVLDIKSDDVNSSYVIKDSDDAHIKLNIPNSSLSIPLDNINITNKNQELTIRFSLSTALAYQSDSQDYLLTTDQDGIRVQDKETKASLTGDVNTNLFSDPISCNDKEDLYKGNRVFLYKSTNLNSDNLADVVPINKAPPNAIIPFDSAPILETDTGYGYGFGFLPPGDYTLAFTCNAEIDDPLLYDDFTIPQPANQTYEITLDSRETPYKCNIDYDLSCQ